MFLLFFLFFLLLFLALFLAALLDVSVAAYSEPSVLTGASEPSVVIGALSEVTTGS